MTYTDNIQLKQNKIIYMILNGAIGDQYGAPIEMMPSELILTRYGEYIDEYILTDKLKDKPYTYTDDTQMTVAVINCLIENDIKKIDKNIILQYYIKYFEPSRGYSLDTYKLFYEYLTTNKIANISYKTSNGGIMRVSPIVVACLNYSDKDILQLVEIIHYPTHLHKEAILTSYMYIKLLIFFYNLEKDKISTVCILNYIQKVMMIDSIDTPELNTKLRYIVENINSDEYDVMDELIGLDGIHCFETLTCALWGVIKNLHQPSKIVSRVITYGGDTDTISSIAGQMTGILFGLESIRLEWLEKLENKDMLIEIAIKLIQSL